MSDMQGEYGDIDSRAKFRSVLDEVLGLAKECARRYPDNGAIESITAQLESMKAKTANGKDPPPEEREGYDAGLVAIRELDSTPDKEVGDLVDAIHPLVAFFEDWPTDEQAKAAAGP
jgi:hypothetical protein